VTTYRVESKPWLRLAASIVCSAASLVHATPLAPWAAPAGETPAPPWTYTGLPAQKPPPTSFRIRELDSRRVLQVVADRSYGNLVHAVPNLRASVLSWRWRVDEPLPLTNLRTKEGDDAALKVCALFDMPRDRVPFIERQLLRFAESRFGEPLPNATLCYVWDPSLPRGQVIPNAYTQRVRYITLNGAAGAWHAERHDLARDFLRAFGDESQEVPLLRAILVGADADNTGGRSVGWVDALRLEAANPPN
jgi:hypothetical protein